MTQNLKDEKRIPINIKRKLMKKNIYKKDKNVFLEPVDYTKILELMSIHYYQ